MHKDILTINSIKAIIPDTMSIHFGGDFNSSVMIQIVFNFYPGSLSIVKSICFKSVQCIELVLYFGHMKDSILILLSFFLIVNQVSSQSTDRFIRVVGNSSHTFMADGLKAEISVSEVAGNDYKKTSPVPFEEVHSRFITELGNIGIPETALVRTDKNTPKANQAPFRNYTLNVNDKTKIQAVQDISLDGVRVSSVLYTFHPADAEIERQLTINAIEDAKRKAESISKEIEMRVGKILNIEDTSTGCCGEIKDSKESVTTVTYHVNVTFELKDK